MEISGAYSAERAAALAGVPKSTIYSWARKGHLIPSVSKRPLLWSYTDLLALRTIYWLRQPKVAFDLEVPATSMPKVKRALEQLRALDLDLFEEGRPIIAVTSQGEVAVNINAMALRLSDGSGMLRGPARRHLSVCQPRLSVRQYRPRTAARPECPSQAGCVKLGPLRTGRGFPGHYC
jgi:DNA-binding transcriptional MerR regulator